MADTQMLLSKISALRQRLDQAHGLVQRAEPADSSEVGALNTVALSVAAGARQQALLEGSLRQFQDGIANAADSGAMPGKLTARGGRLLKQCHEVFAHLRELADLPLLQDETEPFALRHREAAMMTDLVVRTIQAFPDTPSVQLRLCDSLDLVLAVVADRLASLCGGLQQRQNEEDCFHTLAGLLAALAAGQSMDTKPWIALADRVVTAAHQDLPLRFRYEAPNNPVRFVAAHSLATAQVVARVARHEAEWRNRPLDPVMAALVHDVGMLCVPRLILCYPGALEDPQRRAVEVHANAGAELLTRGVQGAPFLAEAAAYHHERLAGTGYPAGLREMQIAPLVRLLAVCDVYTALCAPRPHRPAFDTRTALTDTLLMAEQGGLDRHQAELLLKLSFYPAGTLVELADGAVGLVVATHQGRGDLHTLARPVIGILTDPKGHALAAPRHVDLAESQGLSIVRSLSGAERRRVLGKNYPELA